MVEGLGVQRSLKMLEAVDFLNSVTDIVSFKEKIDTGGFLRIATCSHLERLFKLTPKEAERAIGIFLGEKEKSNEKENDE